MTLFGLLNLSVDTLTKQCIPTVATIPAKGLWPASVATDNTTFGVTAEFQNTVLWEAAT